MVTTNSIMKISLISIIVLISAVTAFAVVPAVAHLDWQAIAADSVSITEKNDNITELSLTTTSNLPPQDDMAHVGFGWIYADETSGFVATIHPSFRDSVQRPYGWHTHNVELELASNGIITHCITAITDNEHAGLAITGDTIKLNVRNSNFLQDFKVEPTAISFDIIFSINCDSGVGIAVHDMEPAAAAAAEEEEEEEEEEGGGQGGGQGGGGGGNPNQ